MTSCHNIPARRAPSHRYCPRASSLRRYEAGADGDEVARAGVGDDAGVGEGTAAGGVMSDTSSLMVSLRLRIGSPRMTFFTSSKFNVSCSISASASCAIHDACQTGARGNAGTDRSYQVQLVLLCLQEFPHARLTCLQQSGTSRGGMRIRQLVSCESMVGVLPVADRSPRADPQGAARRHAPSHFVLDLLAFLRADVLLTVV